MAEWSLALRNLMRNRRRSLSTLLTLAIGLASILLFNGFKEDIRYAMLTVCVRAGGHLQVQQHDYYLYGSGNPTAYAIADYDRLVDAIRRDSQLQPMLAHVTPMLRFGGLAGNFDAGISRTVIGTGFVADEVERMRQWNEFQVPGDIPKFHLVGRAPNTSIVGVGVARVLQLCDDLQLAECQGGSGAGAATTTAGPALASAPATAKLPADIAALADTEQAGNGATKGAGAAQIQLLFSGSRGAPNVATLNVVAAENQGIKELDEITVLLHLSQAQRLVFGRNSPKATAIMVQLNKTADMPAALARVRQVVSDAGGRQSLAVRDFTELYPFFLQAIQLFDVIFGFIFVLIGGIVLFTVGNTMNTAVVERTVEIGTLRAIGLRQGGIRRLFVMEGFMLGCAGALVGVSVAVVVAALVNHSGLTWLPPGDSERQPLQLRVLANVWIVACTVISLIGIAAASAWLPARRAANLNVVEALRHA